MASNELFINSLNFNCVQDNTVQHNDNHLTLTLTNLASSMQLVHAIVQLFFLKKYIVTVVISS